MIKHLSFWLLILFFVNSNLHAQDRQAVKVKAFADIAQSRQFEYPARVINLQIAEVAAETQGRILEFPVQVGDKVEQGQVLIKLDCDRSRIDRNRLLAGLKRLKAKKKLTQQQLDRARGLESSRSISRDELDQRQTELDADSASIEEQLALLESANKSVSDCNIKAPFTGTVINKMSAVGSYANSGSPMVQLLKNDAVELELDLPVDQQNSLKQSGKIQFISDKRTFNVSIRSIMPVVDNLSLQQKIRLRFDSAEVPTGGSFGILHFNSAKRYLAEHFVHKRNDQLGIFLAINNRAKFVALPTAQEGQSVLTSLASDDLIIVSNTVRLRDNDLITLSE
jgi:RND family efflux transporter MFP subunit